jgi:chromosome segregation ATPase
VKLPKTLHEQVEALPKVTARNRERAREWLEQIELPHQTRVERSHRAILALTAEVERLEKRRLSLETSLAAGVQRVGSLEDEVARLTRERDEARAEVERLRETQRKFGTVQEELFQRAEKAEVVIKALVEAGDRLDDTITLRTIHKAVLDGWAEAKRKAGV